MTTEIVMALSAAIVLMLLAIWSLVYGVVLMLRAYIDVRDPCCEHELRDQPRRDRNIKQNQRLTAHRPPPYV